MQKDGTSVDTGPHRPAAVLAIAESQHGGSLVFDNSAVLGPSWRLGKGVAEDARTRSFSPRVEAGLALSVLRT